MLLLDAVFFMIAWISILFMQLDICITSQRVICFRFIAVVWCKNLMFQVKNRSGETQKFMSSLSIYIIMECMTYLEVYISLL